MKLMKMELYVLYTVLMILQQRVAMRRMAAVSYTHLQVLVLDAEGLQADRHAIKIVENNMEEDIDLILAVGAGTIHDISRYIEIGRASCRERVSSPV